MKRSRPAEFIKPVTQLTYRVVETSHHFEVPERGKAKSLLSSGRHKNPLATELGDDLGRSTEAQRTTFQPKILSMYRWVELDPQ